MSHTRWEDPDGRWAITVPATWERRLQSSDFGTTDAIFFVTPPADPEHWEEDPVADAFTVAVMPGVTPAEVIDMWRYLLGEGGVAEPVAQGSRSLAGLPADETVFDGAVAGAARRVRMVCTAVGGALYMVMHGTAPERYAAQEPEVSAALDSFELLPGSAFAPAVRAEPDAEREAASATRTEPSEQPREGIGHRLGSLFHRRGR
jgi:hypothetical protein